MDRALVGRFTPSLFTQETKPSGLSMMPITVAKENEIYIDVIEKLTVLFNSNTTVLNASIDGCVQLKSYLKDKLEMRLIFNDDLVLGHVWLPKKS